MNFFIGLLLFAFLVFTARCLAIPIFYSPARGVASFYDHHFNGRKTASGVVFDASKRTCATQSRSIPFGTILIVTNLANNKRVVVRVTDRMGKHDPKDRIIDLSEAAFAKIEDPRKGLCNVEIQIVK